MSSPKTLSSDVLYGSKRSCVYTGETHVKYKSDQVLEITFREYCKISLRDRCWGF